MSYTSLMNFGTTEIALVSVFGAIFLGIVVYLCFVPMKNYFTALFSGAYIASFKLISIKNRKLEVAYVVNSYIMAKKSKLKISLKEIESLILSGGDAVNVISAINMANSANLKLDFELAEAIELSTHNVKDVVSDSINSKVVEITGIAAFAQDDIELNVKARMSVKINLSKYKDGLGIDDLKGTVNAWILENIAKSKSYKDILREPNRSLLSNLDFRVITQNSMYNIIDINISAVEVGRDLNIEREIKSAEKEKIYAQIESERRKHAEEINAIRQKNKTEEMKQAVLEAEADVPRALSEAIKEGRFNVMDYYKLMNLQADTALRRAFINEKPEDPDFDEGDFF